MSFFAKYRGDDASDLEWVWRQPRFKGDRDSKIVRCRQQPPYARARGTEEFGRRPGTIVRTQATGALHEHLRSLWNPGLRFRGTLGAGGCGLAALFEMTNPAGRKKDIVAKLPLNRRKAPLLADEKAELTAYYRAQHIAQKLSLDGWRQFMRHNDPDPDPGDPPSHLAEEGINDVLDEESVILLEYAKHGDLEGILDKTASLQPPSKNEIPDDALWRIFHCLVMGIVGLEYSPNTVYRAERRPIPDETSPLPEYVPSPRIRNIFGKDVVHFDLDPQNVLAFDEEADHLGMPIFKISDLGLLTRMKDEREQGNFSVMDMWNMRRKGKRNWLTPVQFTSEWDNLRDPREEDVGGVAGAYSHKMNVFAVGLIMWSCMTLCFPEEHLLAENVDVSIEGATKSILTYGAYLNAVERFNQDPRLKHIVQQCLCHHPDDRPDLDDLLDLVNTSAPKDQLGPEVTAWLDDIADPPRPRAPLPAYNPYKPQNEIQINPFEPYPFRP